MTFKQYFIALFTSLSTNLAIILGGYDKLLVVLVVFVVVDYVTGVLKALNKRELNSYLGFQGIVKKTGLFCIVVVGHQLDMVIGVDPAVIRTMIIMFYIANEGISILENANELGISVPKFIKDRLLNMRGDNDENN